MESGLLKECIIRQISNYTTHGALRLYALYDSIMEILEKDIPGDYCEAGVAEGGSCMLVAYLFRERGSNRKIWMYDTFQGMDISDATEYDTNFYNQSAVDRKQAAEQHGGIWCYTPLDVVKDNMEIIGYQNLEYVEGNILDTIPACMPDKIACLHLDTDFYKTTAHELVHLHPLLDRRGICIVDDYGWWAGSRKAVDEFIAVNPGYYIEKIDGCGVYLRHD